MVFSRHAYRSTSAPDVLLDYVKLLSATSLKFLGVIKNLLLTMHWTGNQTKISKFQKIDSNTAY